MPPVSHNLTVPARAFVAFSVEYGLASTRSRRREWRRGNLLRQEPVELQRPGGDVMSKATRPKGVRA